MGDKGIEIVRTPFVGKEIDEIVPTRALQYKIKSPKAKPPLKVEAKADEKTASASTTAATATTTAPVSVSDGPSPQKAGFWPWLQHRIARKANLKYGITVQPASAPASASSTAAVQPTDTKVEAKDSTDSKAAATEKQRADSTSLIPSISTLTSMTNGQSPDAHRSLSAHSVRIRAINLGQDDDMAEHKKRSAFHSCVCLLMCLADSTCVLPVTLIRRAFCSAFRAALRRHSMHLRGFTTKTSNLCCSRAVFTRFPTF